VERNRLQSLSDGIEVIAVLPADALHSVLISVGGCDGALKVICSEVP
jgi:hypothetical protein